MTTVDANSAALDLGGLSLIDRLKCFNAKERYWVVRQALGHFQPTDAFVQAAAKAAGVLPPSESAHSAIYLAMDYHLNWLHAALGSWTPDAKESIENACLPKGSYFGMVEAYKRRFGRLNFRGSPPPPQSSDAACGTGMRIAPWCRAAIENSQEDVDLLLAYPRPDGVTQIILIEAKCIDGFTEEQLESKAVRLAGILEARDNVSMPVDVKLILMSPKKLQSEATVDSRLSIVRSHCERGQGHSDAPHRRNNASTNLVPTTRSETNPDGWGWMNLEVVSPDPEGLWVVKFGTGAKEDREASQTAGKKKERYFWSRWRLERRKDICMEHDQAAARD